MELHTELRTRRLILRPLRTDDAPGLKQKLNNFSVSQFLARVPYPYTLDMAQDFIAKQVNSQDFVCAICFACAPDEILGVVAYERADDGGFEFGYWLAQCCWGLGIMNEAAQTLVQHYFAHRSDGKLMSGYWNPTSGRLLRKLGFVEIGAGKIYSAAQGKEVDFMRMELCARPV